MPKKSARPARKKTVQRSKTDSAKAVAPRVAKTSSTSRSQPKVRKTGLGTEPVEKIMKEEPAAPTSQQSATEKKPFAPFNLETTVIAMPLLNKLNGHEDDLHDVIIDINLTYPGGRAVAKEWVLRTLVQVTKDHDLTNIDRLKSDLCPQYLFGRLTGREIRWLVKLDTEARQKAVGNAKKRAIYHVWPDFEIDAMISRSIRTVKADAARTSFAAIGEDIVWAIIDSGIEETHPHFMQWKNLDTPMEHKDFTGNNAPLRDEFGHGTHVAGIVAGEMRSEEAGAGLSAKKVIRTVSWQRDENDRIIAKRDDTLKVISGMASQCKLLSLKVLGADGKGKASNLISAIAYIQEINGHGRHIMVHGVNMSVGYSFKPEWFACGQSPLCVEVDKLVRSGVVVVAAAGNTGYGSIQPDSAGPASAGLDVTINDPGNAAFAITVGSTHRDMPHTYGVSYFSSKGPTGDGRLKPDLVAPGEKIISCAAGKMLEEARKAAGDCDYLEHSGTSMAAPHVSGVIAAFLSVRREFIGQPERVKQIFLSTAIDLQRERYFQGHGLVDLMQALQSV